MDNEDVQRMLEQLTHQSVTNTITKEALMNTEKTQNIIEIIKLLVELANRLGADKDNVADYLGMSNEDLATISGLLIAVGTAIRPDKGVE